MATALSSTPTGEMRSENLPRFRRAERSSVRLKSEIFTCTSKISGLTLVGIEFLVNLVQDEYLPSISDGAGALIVAHPQHQMPFPEDNSVLVPPGFVTTISVKQVKDEIVTRRFYNPHLSNSVPFSQNNVFRLGGEFSGCVYEKSDDADEISKRNMFSEQFPVNYSMTVACKTNIIIMMSSTAAKLESLSVTGLLQDVLSKTRHRTVRLRRPTIPE